MMEKLNQADKTRKYQWMLTGVTAVLLLLLYFIIFHFSAQDGDESSSLSQRITQKGVEIANSLAGNAWSDEKVAGLEDRYEHFIRKTAHFAEYAYMGVLVYLLWRQWICRKRKLYLLTTGWVFLSAAGDEFHQYFVPGRYASPWDVLLDTCGGFVGMLFCVGVSSLYRRHKKKAMEKVKRKRHLM